MIQNIWSFLRPQSFGDRLALVHGVRSALFQFRRSSTASRSSCAGWGGPARKSVDTAVCGTRWKPSRRTERPSRSSTERYLPQPDARTSYVEISEKSCFAASKISPPPTFSQLELLARKTWTTHNRRMVLDSQWWVRVYVGVTIATAILRPPPQCHWLVLWLDVKVRVRVKRNE